MSALKSWTMVICSVSVICTIIEVLVPNGKMEKVFRLVVGAFMLCAILVPFNTTLHNIKFDNKKNESFISDKSKFKNTVENQTKKSIQKNMKTIIENFLGSKSVKAEKINIIMDTKQDNCISIKKIEVFLSRGDESKKDIIKKDLEHKLEIKTDVFIGSE